MSIALKGRKPSANAITASLGRVKSKEEIEKHRQAMLGKSIPHTPEWNANIGKGNRGKKRAPGQIWIDNGPSSIEICVQDVLKSIGEDFEPHRRFHPYTADIYLPQYSGIIEIDGEYWHSLPNRSKRDSIRDKWFRNMCIETVRLTEAEVKKIPRFIVLAAINLLRVIKMLRTMTSVEE